MEAEGADVEDELEGLQTELEGSLETVGFVIAGFNKLADEFAEAGYKKYDFFDAYSICKLPVIFEVAKHIQKQVHLLLVHSICIKKKVLL